MNPSTLQQRLKTKKGEYKDIHGHAELILAGFEGERGLSRINRIANDYRGETLGECALFQKFMYYFSGKEDREKAYQVLERLKEFYPESMLVSEAQGLLKNMVIHLAKGNVGKVSAESVSVPSKSELFGNYPNPFNLTTVIKYSLEENTKVSLKIFNILGQQIKTLVNDYREAGTYSVIWNGRDSQGIEMPSGIYLYVLKAGDKVFTKKLTLLK